MKNSKYAKAYTEVLEIIKYFPQEEYEKIPLDRIEFYKKNMDNTYIFKINPQIDLSEQNVSKEANAIIVNLFMDYFATIEQKDKIKRILNQNQKEEEEEKRQKYNPDNIFKKPEKTYAKEQNSSNNTALIEYKESFFTKFKNFVLKMFHITKN